MKAKLDYGAFMPERAHGEDAGLDLRSRDSMVVKPGEPVTFDTGVHMEIPQHCCGLLVSKSGLLTKFGISSTGLVDEGYTGSIVVTLINNSKKNYLVRHGDKISQIVILPVCKFPLEQVDELGKTERGDKGFGSTGR